MKISKEKAKEIGNLLKVDWNKIPIEAFTKGINVEREHKSLDKTPDTTTDKDLKIFGKICLDHLRENIKYYDELAKMEKKLKKNESKVERLINNIVKLLREVIDEDFANKLQYEVNKENPKYEKAFNGALGKFKVDSPDQLKSDKEKNEFFSYVESCMSEADETVNEDDEDDKKKKDDEKQFGGAKFMKKHTDSRGDSSFGGANTSAPGLSTGVADRGYAATPYANFGSQGSAEYQGTRNTKDVGQKRAEIEKKKDKKKLTK